MHWISVVAQGSCDSPMTITSLCAHSVECVAYRKQEGMDQHDLARLQNRCSAEWRAGRMVSGPLVTQL